MTASPSPSAPIFTRHARAYDAMRRGFIPCFDRFYGTALDLVGELSGAQPLGVLDLGAGTGLFAALLLERMPDARITCLDASEGMLDEARTRFAGDDRVDFALADMASADLDGPWDVVMSALAIHHLEHEAKKALFARIRNALSPGGLFVNAEQVLGPTPALEERYALRWLADVRAAGVPEGEIDKARDRMRFDRCASIEDQLAWMRAAGFRDVDCSFKSWRFAVLSGRR
jgi:SAM-dependent methyltransferase